LIDAIDLVISPGFIDIHSHTDFSIKDNPKAESKVMQGITTEVVGMCGFSSAPVNGIYSTHMRNENGKEDLLQQIELQENNQ